MSPLYTPSQRAHALKRQELLDNRHYAAENGLEVEHGLAVLDHVFGGWKQLGAMKRNKDVFELREEYPEDVARLDPDEMRDFQIMEVKNALDNGEEIDAFKTMSPEESAFMEELIRRHISQGSISEVGRLGTAGREHAKDYHDPALAGTPIKVTWAPGQQDSRGMGLLMQMAHGIESDTNVGLYGVPIDAMHRRPAGYYPELVAEESNIKFGPQSMNQSDGKREGDNIYASRLSRLLRLNDELFAAEHGAKHDFRKMDINTRRENRFIDDLDKVIVEIRESPR